MSTPFDAPFAGAGLRAVVALLTLTARAADVPGAFQTTPPDKNRQRLTLAGASSPLLRGKFVGSFVRLSVAEKGEETTPQKADYGIDAPVVIRRLALQGTADLLLGVALHLAMRRVRPQLAATSLLAGLPGGAIRLYGAGAMVLHSKVGKLRERDRLLRSIRWRGDEAVLDVGCGRGLLLVGVAKRLTTGRAVGIDLWRKEDESGNCPEAALANARAEGVLGRVEVATADARHLPFADGSFDVVLSSLELHKIPDMPGRERAVRGIARVLKPGGVVAILDVWHTGEYERTLRRCGMSGLERSLPRPSLFTPVRTVRATKPSPHPEGSLPRRAV